MGNQYQLSQNKSHHKTEPSGNMLLNSSQLPLPALPLDGSLVLLDWTG